MLQVIGSELGGVWVRSHLLLGPDTLWVKACASENPVKILTLPITRSRQGWGLSPSLIPYKLCDLRQII